MTPTCTVSFLHSSLTGLLKRVGAESMHDGIFVVSLCVCSLCVQEGLLDPEHSRLKGNRHHDLQCPAGLLEDAASLLGAVSAESKELDPNGKWTALLKEQGIEPKSVHQVLAVLNHNEATAVLRSMKPNTPAG